MKTPNYFFKCVIALTLLLNSSIIVQSQTVSTPITGLGNSLGGVIMDSQGNTYIAIRSASEIKKVDPDGNMTVYCNSGLSDPTGLAFDTQGNLYVADYAAGIRVIPPGGGPATDYVTGLSMPMVIKQYDGDTLVVQEYMSKSVYKIFPGGGYVGSENVILLCTPSGGNRAGGLGIYANKDLLIVNVYGFHVYRMDKTDNSLTLLSNSGSYDPIDISNGYGTDNFYFANWGGHKIQLLDASTGNVSDYAGTGTPGGTDGNLNVAQFNNPYYTYTDSIGNIWITESYTGKIRRIVVGCSASNINLQASGPACSDNSLDLQASFQTTFYAPETFTIGWTGPNSFSGSTTDVSLNNLSFSDNGYYVFTVTDLFGCEVRDSIEISVSQSPQITADASDDIICLGDMVTLSASGADNYLWDSGLGTGSPVTDSPTQTTTYTVTGTDNSGCSGTAQVTVQVDICTDVEETSLNKLVIYPNPANGLFNITFNENTKGKKHILITDITGIVVFEKTSEELKMQIDLLEQSNGIYFVSVFNENNTVAKTKIIKN